jgi:hypothetical protein
MKAVQTSSTNRSEGDDLDGLLRSFFQAELPHPWPQLSVPESKKETPSRNWFSLRRGMTSRLALAASVALLFLGHALISGRLQDALVKQGQGLQNGSAGRDKPLIEKDKKIRIRESLTPSSVLFIVTDEDR